MSEPTIEEPTEPTELDHAQAQLGLPVEHLFMVDPLDLTADDLLVLVAHYRNTRLNYIKAAEKPKTVQKNRNPKLDAEASRKEITNILESLFGDDDD